MLRQFTGSKISFENPKLQAPEGLGLLHDGVSLLHNGVGDVDEVRRWASTSWKFQAAASFG
jgi:hypothetical protein